MIVKIIGLIWVVWGILILIKPEILRKKLQTKGNKKLPAKKIKEKYTSHSF